MLLFRQLREQKLILCFRTSSCFICFLLACTNHEILERILLDQLLLWLSWWLLPNGATSLVSDSGRLPGLSSFFSTLLATVVEIAEEVCEHLVQVVCCELDRRILW